jgi:hypothetical protein
MEKMMDIKTEAEWFRHSRLERLANVLYPGHSSEGTRRVMDRLAATEHSRGPRPQKLLDDRTRGCVSRLGGVAKRGR